MTTIQKKINFRDTSENHRKAKELTNPEELPKNPFEKGQKILELLQASLMRFISSRTIKIKLPQATPGTLARALEEGRGKIKKIGMGPFMLGLGAKMLTVVPLVLTGVGFIVAKALLVGKLALVISLILFIHSFMGGRVSCLFYKHNL